MIPALIAAATIAASYMNKPKDKMSPYLKAALAQIEKVQVPDVESLKVKLNELVQQGQMTPEQAQASLVEYNAFDNTAPNQQARGAQMSALEELQAQVENGGLTDVDRSRIQHTLDEVNNTERGQQGAIMEDAHRRGVSGSGLELANRLMSQQGAADTAGRQGMDIAAMAQQAKMDALKSAASIGGQIESQDFNEQSQKAAAQNAINQFNATNQQQVTMQNIAAKNAAQAMNLGEQQRIADTNTNMVNANRVRDSELLQQNFNNRLNKAKAVGSAMSGTGQSEQNMSNANTAWNANLIGTTNNYLTSNGAAGNNIWGDKVKDNSTLSGYFTPTNGNQVPLRAAHGATVPGEAQYPGDDERNDVVPAMVSPGEKIIPRSEASEYDSFLKDMPRSENKPTPDAVRLVLEALSGMGC